MNIEELLKKAVEENIEVKIDKLYVRLDRCQGINRIEEFDEDINKYKLEDVIYDEWGDETFILDENDVIISSSRIIDLIEVGDIVNYEQLNGGVVLNKKDDSIDTWSILPNSLKNEDIKSVITKEQLKKLYV